MKKENKKKSMDASLTWVGSDPRGVRREIPKWVEVATSEIGKLLKQVQAQANVVDTIAKTLVTLLEQISILNKNVSSIQGDMNRWKEQEEQFEEEMYDERSHSLYPIQHLTLIR